MVTQSRLRLVVKRVDLYLGVNALTSSYTDRYTRDWRGCLAVAPVIITPLRGRS
jgi:hypothetical protein